eukprot:CAMPEP_0197038174 /NCGR_PEP_ID=MMETSP1384-20130603/15160_1 /TAXON_ID=29189 /ORGANISM="Ammonia sp." /LENGTH=297 /DNA_ID=CAMNT_0042468571 /DNA_START=1527 /DNA_END=2420 /DNA_ORIENTATION=-
MDRLTSKDVIGTTIIVGVCVLTMYAIYTNYIKSDESSQKGLTPTKYQKYKLIKKVNVSHNTRKFRFALQSASTELGLPCGKNISFRFFDANQEEVRRPYTPITSNREKGYFDVMIKVYADGKMTQHLDTLVPNKDFIEARGPMGNIRYAKPGLFQIKQKKEMNQYKVSKIGMICGGTGITPMLQIIREIEANHNDETQVSMIFGNVSIDDILLREELEQVRQKHDNIHIRFIIDKAPTDGREWNEDVGYVTQEQLKQRIFPPADDVIVLLCGPPIMTKICKGNLMKLGYDENRVVAF